MRPYLDKAEPEVWKAAQALNQAVAAAASERGLTPSETELMKVRASQINGCAFCLDMHSRESRAAGILQQKLDLIPTWRESTLYTERERSVLAVAEAATGLPLDERAAAELERARAELGDEASAAAEWIAVVINTFNRISILSEHPVRPRSADGRIIREQPRS